MFLLNPKLSRELEEYRAFDNGQLIDQIVELAKPLEGIRVLHLCAAPTRHWLSDSVDALVALMRSVGIDAERRVIISDHGQVGAVRALNRALSGQFAQRGSEMYNAWICYPKDVSVIFREDYDFVVVHDIGLAGLLRDLASRNWIGRPKWIWHCHTDRPNLPSDLLDTVMSSNGFYHARFVSALNVRARSQFAHCSIVPPAIDPFDLSNRYPSEGLIETVMTRHGLERRRPFILVDFRPGQDLAIASRIIDGYRLAKERIAELQLIVLLIGDGDVRRIAEGYHHFAVGLRDVADAVVEPLINGIGNTELNSLQRAAAVVLGECGEEVSDKEAIRLLGAMWKGRPLIVSPKTANLLGIEDGANGWIASSSDEYSSKIVRLLTSSSLSSTIGQQAKRHVQERFLITGLLHKYVATLNELGRPDKMPAYRCSS